ncbi:MAG: ATP/GTP-binding protein [Promethearchaeota archaeon]
MIINALDKTINIKIVYYGPALSGKTTSIKSLFNHFGKLDELISVENTLNRTLFFDYGTMIFQNEEWQLKIHLYSTTGQDFYIVTRPTTLKGVDGLIYVVDSQITAYKRNLISWNELLSYYKTGIEKLPIVICFNKQDLPNKFKSMQFMNEIGYDGFQNMTAEYTTALNGEGVLSSFETILKLIFQDLIKSELLTVESSNYLNT